MIRCSLQHTRTSPALSKRILIDAPVVVFYAETRLSSHGTAFLRGLDAHFLRWDLDNAHLCSVRDAAVGSDLLAVAEVLWTLAEAGWWCLSFSPALLFPHPGFFRTFLGGRTSRRESPLPEFGATRRSSRHVIPTLNNFDPPPPSIVK